MRVHRHLGVRVRPAEQRGALDADGAVAQRRAFGGAGNDADVLGHNPILPMQETESRYAWARMLAALALMTLGGVGIYGVTVVLPEIQAEFGVARSAASLPYTVTWRGCGVGGGRMGRLASRFAGIAAGRVGAAALGLGFVAGWQA